MIDLTIQKGIWEVLWDIGCAIAQRGCHLSKTTGQKLIFKQAAFRAKTIARPTSTVSLLRQKLRVDAGTRVISGDFRGGS